MNADPEARFAHVLAVYRRRRPPRRNRRILQTPAGFVEIVFFGRRRAWVTIYDERGWPSRRLTRWATRGHPSLVRALRRGGFDAREAERLANQISDEWGEPVGDVAEVAIPAVVWLAFGVIGTVVVGRRLLRSVGAGP